MTPWRLQVVASKLGRTSCAAGFSALLADPRLRKFCKSTFGEELDADGSLRVPARLEADAAGFAAPLEASMLDADMSAMSADCCEMQCCAWT